MVRAWVLVTLLALIISSLGTFQAHAYTNSSYTCLDSDVSQYNMYVNETKNTDIEIEITQENITCGFGCNTNTGACNAVGVTDVGIVIAIPFIVLVLAYLGINFAKEEWVMQMLFLIIGMFLLILDIGIGMSIMQNLNTDVSSMLGAGYLALIGTTMIVVMYFFLRIIITAIKTLETGK